LDKSCFACVKAASLGLIIDLEHTILCDTIFLVAVKWSRRRAVQHQAFFAEFGVMAGAQVYPVGVVPVNCTSQMCTSAVEHEQVVSRL
jgi:hypothetical protein